MPKAGSTSIRKISVTYLVDRCVASVGCSYFVAISLRKYRANILAIEISVRAEPELIFQFRRTKSAKCQVATLMPPPSRI
jgi:hypothetical protein